MRIGGLLMLGLWLGWTSAALAEQKPTPEQVQFFEKRIRPLFARHCFKCHGPKKHKGDLRLDTAEGLRKGGLSGAVVVPGHPEKSLLMQAVGYANLELRMPPKQKLPARDLADLRQWVKMGAPYPARYQTEAMELAKARRFWAFQPIHKVAVPAVKDSQWVRTPIDHFLLSQLESKNLRPAPQADRRTLIRRVTFDLTGLPPTPAEVTAFVNDSSPDAWGKVIDRLLASPAYGERWGRHWLDVARYADSNGLDENIAHGNAWRYRDLVVSAFNADQPYDQFVLEQLAGDLLPSSNPEERNRRLIATGFLSMGPKVLAEVDEKKMEMDIVDEQISTVGRAFLGLTLGCARCHDHKFDPISTRDYYALVGIFKSTHTMQSFRKIARWHENLLRTPQAKAHEARLAQLRKTLADLTQQLKEAEVADSCAGPEKGATQEMKRLKVEVKKVQKELAKVQKAADALPSAMGVLDGKVADAHIARRGDHLNLGPVVPRHFPVVVAGKDQPPLPADQSGRLQLASWLIRRDHPLTARVMVNRIWRWHFGKGIVTSTDNFGRLGTRPTHPELLDWLAQRFIDSGWSIKTMHRLILRSAAYRMSCQTLATSSPRQAGPPRTTSLGGPVAGAKEQSNALTHFPVRRLEAEAIRDALLSVGGLLDRRMGGSLLHVKNREFFFNHTSQDKTRYESPRRSLYLPVVRNHLYAVFELFDATDAAVPDGDRSTTTVAPQALFMMNSKLVLKASEGLARGLLEECNTDSERVKLLYRKTYGREPTTREMDRLLRLQDRLEKMSELAAKDASKGREQSWTLVCQVVLAANEFIYIR